MNFLKKIYNNLSYIQKRKILKDLVYLIEQEKSFISSNFSLEFLEAKTGADQKKINQLLLEKYRMPFYSLTRTLRVQCLHQLVQKSNNEINLNDLSDFCGYTDSEAMLRDLKIETGLDFDEFCRYASNINSRIIESKD